MVYYFSNINFILKQKQKIMYDKVFQKLNSFLKESRKNNVDTLLFGNGQYIKFSINHKQFTVYEKDFEKILNEDLSIYLY